LVFELQELVRVDRCGGVKRQPWRRFLALEACLEFLQEHVGTVVVDILKLQFAVVA